MELGIGIVGSGFIGKVHAFAHRSLPLFYDPLPAKTRLVGVCTATEASGRKAQEQAEFTFATTNYQDLLARDDIHVIHCCTPNDAHHALLMDALKAGKHVYCDKPLTRTLAEAEGVAALVRATDKVHRMTFTASFRPFCGRKNWSTTVFSARCINFGPAACAQALWTQTGP